MTPELALALVMEEDHPEYDNYEFIVEGEEDGFVAFDISAYHHVVKNSTTGDLYQIDYEVSYQDGVHEISIGYCPVVAKEVITTVYELKKG